MIYHLISDLSIPTLVLFGLVAALAYYYISIKWSNLPPGPTPIPFIGNLHLLASKKLFAAFEDFRNQYGDIYTIHIGQQPTVVVCGYENIKEAFLTQGETFADHPESFLTKQLAAGRGIISANGPVWKANRRFTLSTLRDFGLGRNIMQERILEEVEFLTNILQDAAKYKRNIDFKDKIFCSVSNTMNSVIFGSRFDYCDREFITMKTAMRENFKLIGHMGLLNVYQWLRFLPGDLFKAKQLLKGAETFMKIIKGIADKHKAVYDKSDVHDFIDAYTKEIGRRQNEPDSLFCREQMENVVADLFMAGSDTTTTLFCWIFAYLINYPDIQEEVARHIHEAIGEDRVPTLADKKSLPLVEATVMETLRHSDMVGIALPHCPARHAKLLGYDVPAKTPVVPLLHSIWFDKKLWGDPETFRPSRWLDEEGKLFIPEQAIFFFIGKRSCIGESLAKMNSFLFTASILQKFRLSAPDGCENPSLVGEHGMTFAPPDYNVKITVRK